MSRADELRRRSILMRVLLPPGGSVPENSIRFRHVSVFGPPESGKTTLALWAAAVVEEVVEEQGVDFVCIRSMSVSDAIDALGEAELEPPFYAYVLVDDAEAMQSSLRQGSNMVWESMLMHNTVRHQFALKGLSGGYVALVYSTQRFQNLQRLFRSGHAVVFKSLSVNDPVEKEYYVQWLGEDVVEELLTLTSMVYEHHRDDVKSYYLVRNLVGESQWERMGPPRQPKKVVDVWKRRVEHRPNMLKKMFGRLVPDSPELVAVAARIACDALRNKWSGERLARLASKAPRFLKAIGAFPVVADYHPDNYYYEDFLKDKGEDLGFDWEKVKAFLRAAVETYSELEDLSQCLEEEQ